jgi:hypothetical protein
MLGVILAYFTIEDILGLNGAIMFFPFLKKRKVQLL